MSNAAQRGQQAAARANAQHQIVHQRMVDKQKQGADYVQHVNARQDSDGRGTPSEPGGAAFQIVLAIVIVLVFAALIGGGVALVLHERARFDHSPTAPAR